MIFDANVMGDIKQGDTIMNKAAIFFDYNSPVITNYAYIMREDDSNSIPNIPKRSTMRAYPNPAKDYIVLDNLSTLAQEIVIYDMKGALIYKGRVNPASKGQVNTGSWARGIYLVVSSYGETAKVVLE